MSTVYYHTTAPEPSLCVREGNAWVRQPMEKYPERKHWFYATVPDLRQFGCLDNTEPGQSSNSFFAFSPGKYAVYKGRLVQIKDTASPILLVADLDNTLVGTTQNMRQATSRFADFWLKHHYFSGSKLVYNTGRNYQLYLRLYEDGQDLLEPDMVVTGVGNTAYTIDPETGEYSEHPSFADLYDLTHWNSEVVAALLREKFPWAISQNSMRVLPLKVWGTGLAEDYVHGLSELQRVLKNVDNEEFQGFVYKAKVILSNHGNRKFVDITPMGGGKKVGLLYAQQFFGFGDSRTLVAGDSGNDIEMFKGNHYGVVVSNFQQELGDWLLKKPRPNKYLSKLSWADAVIEALEWMQ